MANTLVDDRMGAAAKDADFSGAACEVFVIYLTEGADRQSLPHKNRFYVYFFSPKTIGTHDDVCRPAVEGGV